MTAKYSVIAQAIPSEVLACESIEQTILADLLRHPRVDEVIVALAAIDDVFAAHEKLKAWGVKSMAGAGYNVCERLLEAAKMLPPQPFIVRVLLVNLHTPLRYVDAQVDCMLNERVDFVTAPLDYNISLCADVASLESLERIIEMPDVIIKNKRALFNPFCYIDNNPEQFSVCMLEPAPFFSKTELEDVVSFPRVREDYCYMGRDFSAGRYNYLLESGFIPRKAQVLDIASATGQGAHLMPSTEPL